MKAKDYNNDPVSAGDKFLGTDENGKTKNFTPESVAEYVGNNMPSVDVVQDQIVDGVVNKAPSQNAVYDALQGKQDSLGFVAESLSNKSTSIVSDQASNTKYPSVKAVYDWVISQIGSLSNLLPLNNNWTGLNIFHKTTKFRGHLDSSKTAIDVPAAGGTSLFKVTDTGVENVRLTGITGGAKGFFSHAEGEDTLAQGDYSHAEGYGTQALGWASSSKGINTIANSYYSSAEGNNTQTNGESAHAEGANTQANGIASHAEGQGAVASSNYSHAEGFNTQANGEASHAEGTSSISNSVGGHAEGMNTNDLAAEAGHAEGIESIVYGSAGHAEGIYTVVNGTGAHSEGEGTIAVGYTSHAEGNYTQANGESSHSQNTNTQANGDHSHAEGYGTIANSISSHSEGYLTIANAPYSHTENNRTNTYGNSSHAEGELTKTGIYGIPGNVVNGLVTITGLGDLSSYFNTGSGNRVYYSDNYDIYITGVVSTNYTAPYFTIQLSDITINGYYDFCNFDVPYPTNIPAAQPNVYLGVAAHSEGIATFAMGKYSHAEGINTRSIGKASHSGGENTHANGLKSFVHGTDSEANGNNTIVLGREIIGDEDDVTYVDQFNVKRLYKANAKYSLALDELGFLVEDRAVSGGAYWLSGSPGSLTPPNVNTATNLESHILIDGSISGNMWTFNTSGADYSININNANFVPQSKWRGIAYSSLSNTITFISDGIETGTVNPPLSLINLIKIATTIQGGYIKHAFVWKKILNSTQRDNLIFTNGVADTSVFYGSNVPFVRLEADNIANNGINNIWYDTSGNYNDALLLGNMVLPKPWATTSALINKADLVAGKVPSSQLPSFVDDVLEFLDFTSFPITGETGKIYVALDTNLTFRWSGTAYVEISASLALGETSSTAYRGDRGKMAYDHSQTAGNPHNTQIEDISGLTAALSNKFDKPTLTTLTTTNSTTTIAVTIPIPLNTNKSIRFHVKGRNSTSGTSIGAECFVVFNNISGVVTQVGTLSIDRKSGFTNSVTASTSVAGTNGLINITGANAQTINWEIYLREIL